MSLKRGDSNKSLGANAAAVNVLNSTNMITSEDIYIPAVRALDKYTTSAEMKDLVPNIQVHKKK